MFPRLPRAAVVAVAIILASEAVFLATTEPLTGLPYLQPTGDDAIIAAKQKLIDQTAGGILLVGDSSCTMGLQPRLIEAETGRRAVNLGAISTMTFAGFADLTARACALPRPPAQIVVAVLPQSFEVTGERAHEFGLVGRYLTAYGRRSPIFSPTIRERWDWLVRKHRVNIFPPQFGGSYARYEQDLLSTGGWYPERGRYAFKDGDLRERFQPSAFATQGLMELAAACGSHKVPLTFWWSPSPEDSATPGYAAEVKGFTDRLRTMLPHAAFPRETVPRWAASQFGSVTHVTPQAAEINTRELAAALISGTK